MRKASRRVGRPAKKLDENIKDQILNSFLTLSKEESIESITLQKIADRSGVGLSTVRYHFQLQGQTISEVALRYVSDKTYEYLDRFLLNARNSKKFDPVKAYVLAQFSWISDHPLQASFLMYYFYLCSTQVPISISNLELIEIGRRRVLSLIHEGLGMGIYKFPKNASDIGLDCHTYITGALVLAVTSRDIEFLKAQKNLCLKYIGEQLNSED